MTERKGPLHGVRVIDFGQYIAGPAVGMMLADQGAEVIRIDPPGGPIWQNPANAVLNRGKQSVILDLKQPDARAEAERLILGADVVIENFRPGVMDRLGLGSDVLTAQNPGLVYLCLPGFSSRDPERASLQAWEGVIAASSGQFTDMGLNRVLMGINPSFSPLPLASAYGAALGAMSVGLALYARQTTGIGDIIEVPLASSLMEGLAYNSMQVEGLPERYNSLREREIDRRRTAGEPLDMSFPDLQAFLDPFYRTYECADGRPFYAVCSSHTKHPVKTLELLGLWEQAQKDGIPLESSYEDLADWSQGADCTLYAYPLSKRWADMLSERMKEAFKAKTADEWELAFGDYGVPGAALRTTEEWLSNAHALESSLVLEVEDPVYGTMRQAGNVAWLKDDSDRVIEKRPAPASGESGQAPVADRAAFDARPQMDTIGGWLDGVSILDLTNVIAGPTIAATLARFGASVISVDPVEPTLDSWNTIVFGFQANRGKRSVLADITSDDGRELLRQLIAKSDVITINALDRQLAPLGLDEPSLREINPDVILCQFDAFGGPTRGRRSDHPGYDDLAQAATGVMERFGGSLKTPEEHAHFGTIDVLGGFCAAQAIAFALYQRAVTGKVDVARSSLAAAGQLIQIPFMYDYDGREAFDEPRGRDAKGWGPLYRCYEASDGWLFFGTTKDRLVELAVVPEFAGIDSAPEDELEDRLAEGFGERSVTDWVSQLRALDFGICPTASMSRIREESLVRESEASPDLYGPTFSFVRHDRHPSGRIIDLVAPNSVRPERFGLIVPGDAPKYGTHSREVLAELGYDQEGIDALIAEGVVSESWSARYLPD